MARQAKNTASNTVVGQAAHLKATEEALVQVGKIDEQSDKDALEEMREKLADTFNHYPDIDYLWVVKDDAFSAFLPNDLVMAENHANLVNRKIVKLPR